MTVFHSFVCLSEYSPVFRAFVQISTSVLHSLCWTRKVTVVRAVLSFRRRESRRELLQVLATHMTLIRTFAQVNKTSVNDKSDKIALLSRATLILKPVSFGFCCFPRSQLGALAITAVKVPLLYSLTICLTFVYFVPVCLFVVVVDDVIADVSLIL